jgi:peptide/nickel transport system permease protein
VLLYALKRLLNLVPVFIAATLVSFVLIGSVPRADRQSLLNDRRRDTRTAHKTLEVMVKRFGLDRPLLVQYGLWLKNLVTAGDLGVSLDENRPVFEVIAPRIRNSFLLVIGQIVFLYALAIPLGVFGAVRQYSRADQISSLVSYLLLGFPSFFLGLMVVFLLVQFKLRTGFFLLPVGGMTSPEADSFSGLQQFFDLLWHAVAPLFTITLIGVASLSRFMRAQMLEFLHHDFVRTARAKGLSERRVIYKHTLKNAITPFVSSIGGLLPAMVGGAGFVEVVFNWPGITPLLLKAINTLDVYVLIGLIALTLLLLIVGNFISDVLLAVLDPRVEFN